MTSKTPKSGKPSPPLETENFEDNRVEYFSDEATSRRPAKSARDKIKDLLASRPHSAHELQEKLGRTYPEAEVEDALALARERRWLQTDEEIAEMTAATLSRKGKGAEFINETLRSKGLPPVTVRVEEEIEKGLAIVAGKLPISGAIDYEIEKKIYRLLANRGFSEDTVQGVLASLKTPSN